MAIPCGENYDPLFPDQPVVDQYLQLWARHGAFADKEAFKWVDMTGKGTNSISFAQLNENATVIAAELLHRFHLQHGDRVIAVFPPTGLQFIELLFGSQRAGLVLIPISPSEPSSSNREDHHNLIQRMNALAPKLIIAPKDYCLAFNRFLRKYRARYGFGNMLNLPTAATFLSHGVVRGGFTFQEKRDSNSSVEVQTMDSIAKGRYGCKPDDTYLVQYTSGTTGTPKATIITAGAAAHNVRAVRKAYALSPSSVIISWLPLYHDCGLMLVLSSVVAGCSMVVTSPFYFVQRPMLWLEMVSNFKGSVTAVPAFALPLTCSKLENSNSNSNSNTPNSKLDLSRLETMMVMNEPVLASLVSDFVETFEGWGLKESVTAPSYGLAELCTFACTSWVPNSAPLPTSGGIVACGRISETSEDFEIRIVDPETCVEMRDGEEGEIWIASASKAAGFLNDRERSERDLQATMSLSESTSKFLRTGDLGRVSDGFLFVTGRVADVIAINGRSWHPHEIEKTVFGSSGDLLRSGCAVAFSICPRPPFSGKDKKPFVVILAELKDANRGDYHQRATLIDTIRLNLRLNHRGFQASVIGLLPPRTLPKTTSGKLRRSESRNRFISHKLPLLDIYHVSPFPRTSAL